MMIFDKSWKKVKKKAMQIPKGVAFQAEERARANVLGQNHAGCARNDEEVRGHWSETGK